ncbi:hypothetical protein BSL78_22029 [Apostichopus japonicus]|uniref:CRIB domain-containing protein n=1 Tax=Stichopus japonicus TaxID=307972 RepID=A0A2G8JZH8_STIJA|nr:hypothetical protein BSL78_22029 [Apostichopus japonicus]
MTPSFTPDRQNHHPPESHRLCLSRKRIDRSMIGLPQNFQHTVHLGSGDMTASQNSQISSIQTQMSSKGGYESNGTHPVELDRTVVDVQRTDTEE